MLYKVNAEAEGEGAELAEEFKVEGYPTFVVTNAGAETISRWWGYDDGGADFIATVTDAAADPTTIAEKMERFEAEPTAKDAATVGYYYLTREEALEAVTWLERAIELGDPEEVYEYLLVMATSVGIEDELFSLDDLKTAANRALASPHMSQQQTVNVAFMVTRQLRADDAQGVAPYIEAGLAATEGSDDEDLQRSRQRLLIDEALLVRGDTRLAVDLRRETLDDGWDSDPDQLNGFAWWCFENEVNLEEAEALARRGAELAEDDAKKAQIIDTVAEIVNLRGDRAGAAELIQQAVALNPDSSYYQEQLDRFATAVADAD